MINNKKNLIILASIFLSSCQYFAYYDSIPIVKAAVFGFDTTPVTEEEFNSNDFSFIVASLKKGKEARFVLSAIEESGLERWVGVNGVKIYTFKGVVVKTDGFDHDFEILNWNKIKLKESNFLVFFSNPNAVFDQSMKPVEVKNAKINFHFEGSIDVTYIREQVELKQLSSTKHNLYWMDSRGYTKRTTQFLNPKIPPITIDFFYKF